MEFVVSVVSGVVTEIAKYTVVPLLRPIARPFRPFWKYDEYFQKLQTKASELQEKRGALLNLIGDGVEPPLEFKTWQDRVNVTFGEIVALRDEQQRMMNSFCCNVQQCCNHRLSVARALEKACNLERESVDSNDQWKYMIHIANLKKVVEEDLRLEEERVLKEIKEGERPLSNVRIWLDRVGAVS